MAKRTASQIGRSNSRNSKAHERRVADLLTEWSGRKFRRRRNEGRDASTILIESTGDVIPIDGKVKFNIEAKKHKNFSFTSIISNTKTCMLSGFWHQATYDSNLLTKYGGFKTYPLLFFKPNVNVDWVAVSVEGYESLTCVDGQQKYKFPHFRFDYYDDIIVTNNVKHTKNKNNKEFVELQLPSCIITDWKEFAKHINPESMFI